MAHSGEKVRFRAVGCLGTCQGISEKLFLSGLLRSLAVQHLYQLDCQHVCPHRIIHTDDLYGDPVVIPVISLFLQFHVKLTLTGCESFYNRFPGCELFKILPVGRVDIRGGNPQQFIIDPASLIRTDLFLNETVVCIFCKVDTHDQWIRCTGGCPQGLVLDPLLLFLGLLQKVHLRNIRKNSLDHVKTIRIDKAFHDHTDPHRRTVIFPGLSCIGDDAAAHTEAADL